MSNKKCFLDSKIVLISLSAAFSLLLNCPYERERCATKKFRFCTTHYRDLQTPLQRKKRIRSIRGRCCEAARRLALTLKKLIHLFQRLNSQPRFQSPIKEARETCYWLKLLFHSSYLDDKTFSSLVADSDELCKLLYSILKSSGRIRENG